nr:arylmalonate decarboxylase [Aurantimonas sp. VKM B-3413]
MIVPPAAGEVPPEARAVYPGLAFRAVGLGLREMSPADYARVTEIIGDAAKRLGRSGACVVGVMGTSLSFYRGAAFNSRLAEIVAERSGCPASTMSSAIVRALEAVSARRLAVLTAYEDDVNELLRTFLQESGFAVQALHSLRIRAVQDVAGVSTGALVEAGRRVLAAAAPADALLISCGGLQTIETVAALEAEQPLPVVTSATAGVWDLARLAGMHASRHGFGRLFEIG